MKQVLGWVVVAVTTLFVAFNLDRANVWLFGWRMEIPLALVVIGSAGLGALGMYLFSTFKAQKKSTPKK